VAEFAVVPDVIVRTDTLRLPARLTDEVATFIEPLACVVKSLQRAGLQASDRIVIIGLGVMGMLHILMARELGAEQIIGIDRVPSRLTRGKTVGADVVIDTTRESAPDVVRDHTDGLGADVVIVGPGTRDAVALGFQTVGPGGTLVLFTPTPPQTRWVLPIHDAYFNEIRIVPTYSAGPPQTQEALRWLQRGLAVDQLISHRYSLDGALDGYKLVCEATDALKVVIHP
jgi:L-iditol 2-dehydrogenase